MKNGADFDDKTFWRQLEELSMMYISESIRNVTPTSSELTREIKDGGFDGKIIINITENDDILHTVMMEAKFRTTVKSLPLQDCSKSLIIAFNRAVHTLYIVTNVGFSKQALDEIENFEKKINLKVNKVDGYKLRQFAEKIDLASKETFSEEFLKYIYNDTSEKTDLTIKFAEDKGVSKITPKSTRVIKENYKLFKNDLFENLLKQTVRQMLQGHNMFIIQGVAGVGKTIFLRQLQKELRKKKKELHIIDLQLCSSPRVLLINIMEALWGSELSALFTSDDPKYIRKELEDLIGCLSDGTLDENILGAVVQAICMDQTALQGHADMYYYYLSEFIYKLIVPYDQHNTFLFAFYNLNKAEIDALNFLYTLLCKIHSVVTLVVEFRTPFFLETDEKNIISPKEYYNKFTNISAYMYFIDMVPFGELDVRNFIKANKLNLSARQMEIVIERLGTIPLYLMLGLSFLKSQLDEYRIGGIELTDSQLNGMLAEFSGTGINILMTIISYYKQNPVISDCFEAVVLLDGELPLAILKHIDKSNYEQTTELMIETSLFIATSKALVVRHNLIYDSMKKMSSDAARARIAADILANHKASCFSIKNEQIKLFELNFHAGNFETILDEIEDLSQFLLKEHEYYSVIKYNDLALQSVEKLNFINRNGIKRACILITILFSYTQLHIFGTKDVKRKLKMLETIVNLNKYDEDYDTIKLWYMWIQWYIDFYSGNIKESYDIIIKAKEIIDGNKQYDEQLCGQIYWSHGLSHKRQTTLQQGIEDFKEGSRKYPNCFLLKNAVIVHEAHQYLRTNPRKTHQMCEDLVKFIENTDCFYNEVIQARVDMAMSSFYAGNYETALGEAWKDHEIARANNITFQEGRTMNIIAASELAKDEVDAALSDFKRSCSIFKESGNQLFLWRPSFNIGQIYYKSGNIEKAIKHYKNFLDHEISNVTERLETFTLHNCEMVCILYIARIFRENGQRKEMDALIDAYQCTCFNKYFEMDDNAFEAALSELSYIHNGYIIILG